MTIKQLVKICHKIAVEKGFWGECYHCRGTGQIEIITSTIKPLANNKVISNKHYITKDKKIKETCGGCEGRGYSTDRNDGELLMLIVSELAEALEALRKEDKENFEEEIADTFIRLADLCGGRDIDIEKIINKKIKKNKRRPYKHGKAF